jgi:cellulose synthase/poly-beta-1,6-N-acetylglucosamine synthase-like glycosyltransferase
LELTEFVFWSALLLLVYVYVGYPGLAALRARVRPRPARIAPIQPVVSIIVVVHNEETRIAQRIENLLALEYPPEQLDIVIGCDGCTDHTVQIARGYAASGVRVFGFTERRGKAAVINNVVPQVRGDIVVFADARQRFEAGSVRALVANFADPSVGAVSGELMLATGADTAAAARGAAFYWRYEKFIRSAEGRADSTVGATGAIYGIRRELFEPVPADTILDDVMIPMRIVRRGYRALFEPAARAYDIASASAQQEFVRKARTNAGTFQLFARERWLLNPWRNRLWFETISHKGLRLTLPLLHAMLFVSNVVVGRALGFGVWDFYSWALGGQVAFYTAALVGHLLGQSRRRSFVFGVPCAICLLSWATVIGFARFVTNRQQVTWEKPTSVASAGPASIRSAAARPSAAVPS